MQKVPELPTDPLQSLMNTNLSMHRVKFHRAWQRKFSEEKEQFPINWITAEFTKGWEPSAARVERLQGIHGALGRDPRTAAD